VGLRRVTAASLPKNDHSRGDNRLCTLLDFHELLETLLEEAFSLDGAVSLDDPEGMSARG
jgi:hypothetical protein